MSLEELEQVVLVGFSEAFEVEDLPEVRVASVSDVDEVGLDEGFGRGGTDLEGFEEGVDAGGGCVDAFCEASGGG
jgi:hypothetical protein